MARIITLKIAGTETKADAGSTILDIARANEVFIPTLCSFKGLSNVGACRLCMVEVRGVDRTGAALPVWRGCRRLAPDERFLLGDTPGSFDSRYFGPVRTRDLEGVFRETLTW